MLGLTLLALGLITGCQLHKTATVTNERDYASPATNQPTVIYVVDFELPAGLSIKDAPAGGRGGVRGDKKTPFRLTRNGVWSFYGIKSNFSSPSTI